MDAPTDNRSSVSAATERAQPVSGMVPGILERCEQEYVQLPSLCSPVVLEALHNADF